MNHLALYEFVSEAIKKQIKTNRLMIQLAVFNVTLQHFLKSASKE